MIEYHDSWQTDQRRLALYQETLNRFIKELGSLKSIVDRMSADFMRNVEAYIRLTTEKNRLAVDLKERRHHVSHL
ncbi:hypothetical protein U1Q18_017659 [Sarracenia purpurea var. burkii]